VVLQYVQHHGLPRRRSLTCQQWRVSGW
jgi:hypothetical protein